MCIKSNGNVDLLLMVLSTAKNRPQREIIRETWASISKGNKATVRHVFLFGTVAPVYTAVLDFERRKYHDIIQADFVDSYYNLTRKSLMAFHWASTYCENAKYILKIDDDMWVNTPRMLDMIRRGEMGKFINDRNYGGSCYSGSLPIRNPNSKYYASRQAWPHDQYPAFCDGQTGYILTPKVAADLYHMSKNVPFFHLEDVYIGLCMKALGNEIKPINGFFKGLSGTVNDMCFYKKEVFTVHKVSVERLRTIWNTRCYASDISSQTIQGVFSS
ncbi:beta-1,3-galactosyltransferase 1-like [Tubulanus polymorphus]|uniref:beta-1,3-galactosyltransferase 1-like n=1 Tax=Tubulanus polymorphus TaxID=672921 RepID=UPI003DA33130